MKNKDIEDSLKQALNEAPELDFEKLWNTPVTKMTEHDSITEQGKTDIRKGKPTAEKVRNSEKA